ncbi:MAG: DUF4276 family protein [Candidatus Nealsonbacteria bacterium]|nr:DUF4276 family protein [Candidatus Nealsonbacteria bacterium]
MILNLGCIVEGHAEVAAVPELVRRFQQTLDPGIGLVIRPPTRIGKGKLITDGEIERQVERLARQLTPPRAILILIDADKDCPAELGPKLLARAKAARPDVSTAVVLAKCEYEAWLLAAIESLKGKRGLAEDLAPVEDPEMIRGAKELLGRCMVGSRKYAETVDQPALTALFDMELARRHSPSFDKCWREIERLFAAAQEQPENGP